MGQQLMAPQPRPGDEDRWANPVDCREAGVLVLLYPPPTNGAGPELSLVLTRRAEYPGVHSGQISLPGGQREAGELLETTALRETIEEIGVPAHQVEIIGKLSPLYTPPSGFCIYPFVAVSRQRPNFLPDAQEVAEIIEASLSGLLDPATHKTEIWHFEKYGERRVPFFDVFGYKVWGATAMILSELVLVLNNQKLNPKY
jgi:8-oxo-dGTP pyrophosphatase MutT (NUDIX family)